nr:pectinesterase 2-like [Tanacetum cinerariifolium]
MMKSFLFLATLVASVFLFQSPVVCGYTKSEITSWCSQTPHPQPCEHFLGTTSNYGPIKQKPDFLNALLKVTLESAKYAGSHTLTLGPKCRNKLEKAAWADCLELYENTILTINKTVDPYQKCSQVDMQTWLSTALTNLETCKAGFQELGFPTWVKTGDRKLLQSTAPRANVVVAQDGSGNFRTIAAAIAAAGKRSGSGRYVIHVKAGVYKENIEVGKKLKNIMLLGDGIGKTIITGSKSVGGGTTTFKSATLETQLAPEITKPWLSAAALISRYFINAASKAAVLQNCNIYARKPPNKTNTLTAQGRTDQNQNTGISIHNCRVTAASDLKGVLGVKTYLGRPWKQYSRTVFLKTNLDSLIDPAGWMPWSGNFALNTLYYGEYLNTGPGASTSRRVNWKGHHVITSSTEASKFTVGNFIAGGSWLPATSVPFTSGL